MVDLDWRVLYDLVNAPQHPDPVLALYEDAAFRGEINWSQLTSSFDRRGMELLFFEMARHVDTVAKVEGLLDAFNAAAQRGWNWRSTTGLAGDHLIERANPKKKAVALPTGWEAAAVRVARSSDLSGSRWARHMLTAAGHRIVSPPQTEQGGKAIG